MRQIDIKTTFGTDLGLESICVPDLIDNAYIPVTDNAYVFDRDKLLPVLHYLYKSYGDALFLVGPAGVGKTTLINQVASRLGWPVHEVTLCNRSVITDLVGTPVVFDNAMQYVYGPLTLAMMHGHILILNEIDTIGAGDLTFLNDVIEGRMLQAPDNPSLKVKAHPLFRVVFTANTRGDGDDCGFYNGTRLFNQAFVDRLRFITFENNSPELERQILKLHCTKLSDEDINLMLSFVKEVRFNTIGNLNGAEQLTSPLTTRSLVKIGRYVCDFEKVSIQQSISSFYASRFSEVESEYIMRLCADVFGNSPYYIGKSDREYDMADTKDTAQKISSAPPETDVITAQDGAVAKADGAKSTVRRGRRKSVAKGSS